MGARSVSPGGALLRSSRIFSLPKPLPEPQSQNLHIGEFKSNTMTREYPQHQSITTPLSSREKGDWGFKRPFPLKSTVTTSTPFIRVKRVDTVENVTDFSSAADHTLSREKFQELRVAMTVPPNVKSRTNLPNHGLKSVFEEDSDVTDLENNKGNELRWKFRGPWLARMTEGDFNEYLVDQVRPKRAEFRTMLKTYLAEDITTSQNNLAKEAGTPTPPNVEARHITEDQLTEYLCKLRNDRVTLYSLISQFLDLAPLGKPAGFLDAMWDKSGKGPVESPYGKSGPPPTHPSAGIGYLRTNSFMENHPVYGPQSARTPALARVVYPRNGASAAKLGVGGFVANAPAGEYQFNVRYGKGRRAGNREMLKGISHLDISTQGGAKAYIEPETATVDPSGKIILRLREANEEAQIIAKEGKGLSQVYDDRSMNRTLPSEQAGPQTSGSSVMPRMARLADEIMEQRPQKARAKEKDMVSSSQAYGLDLPQDGRQ